MNIKMDPKRIEAASTELRQAKKNIDLAVSETEEVIRSLKKSEDEMSQELAAALTKTAENLRRKKRTLAQMTAALERAARLQKRCEERIQSHEDAGSIRIPKIHTQNISGIAKKLAKTFERM